MIAKRLLVLVGLLLVDTSDGGTDFDEDGVPLRIAYEQIDVGYDFSFLAYEATRRLFIEEIYVARRLRD